MLVAVAEALPETTSLSLTNPCAKIPVSMVSRYSSPVTRAMRRGDVLFMMQKYGDQSVTVPFAISHAAQVSVQRTDANLGHMLDALLQLALIVIGVKVALGRSNQVVCSDAPSFKTTDADLVALASRYMVRSSQRPIVLSTINLNTQIIHGHLEVRECRHEGLCEFCNGLSSHSGTPVVDGKGSTPRKK